MAKVDKIHVEFGVSVASGDKAWIKATAGMDVQFEPGDKTDENFEMAWNRVTHEVGEQIKHFGVQVVNNETGETVK